MERSSGVSLAERVAGVPCRAGSLTSTVTLLQLRCHTSTRSKMCGYDTTSSGNVAAMRWNSGLPNVVARASIGSRTATFIRSRLPAVPLCICRKTNPG